MAAILNDTMTKIECIGNADRTALLPSHEGINVLPNTPFFAKLIRHARRNRLAVYDVDMGLKKTYGDILSDALTLRQVIKKQLGSDVLAALRAGREIYVGVLSAGGYEFTVAMLAVLALGAAAVPMTVVNPVEECAYFVSKSQQVALISSTAAYDLAQATVKRVAADGLDVVHVDVLPHMPRKPQFSPYDMVVSSDLYLNENSAGVVIFTSGTTGRPKGAVMRRAYTHETSMAIAEEHGIQASDVLLHILPVHHATGLGTSFFPFLITGAAIEFKRGSFDPDWVWKRFRQGGITVFSAVPTIFMRLMWHFQKVIAKLPEPEKQAYVQGARQLKSLLCGSSALQQPTQDFWTNLRDRPILVRYGSSEVPNCLKVPADADFSSLPKGCVGTAVPGVDAVLSEGGELLVKSPYMFSKYLYDEDATAAAHDENGFFKTGDICRKEGNFFFIIGRASLDIIKSGGYKIGALDIEKECLELPYINEALVVGVEDEEFGQRVGAIVTLNPEQTVYSSGGRPLGIDDLRNDLRKHLPGYKLPTLLRVVDGELPKGQTGKVQKKVLGPLYFRTPGWRNDSNVQCWVKGGMQARARL
ncbi:hypothetical protein MBLNU457_7557t1 [Dothideomycetes sp. NU457]